MEHLSLAFNKVNEKKKKQEEVNEIKKGKKCMTGMKRHKTTGL
jgi:hypothetical protein